MPARNSIHSSATERLKRLPPPDRERVRDWFATLPRAEAAARLAAEFRFTCARRALSSFLEWYARQDRLDNDNRVVELFEEFYHRMQPLASREKVRQVTLAFFLAETADRRERRRFRPPAISAECPHPRPAITHREVKSSPNRA